MKIRVLLSTFCTFWGLVALSSCDNTISPLADDSENIVAIHGFLDAIADTHYVRVSALRSTILEDNPGLDGVTVQSVELETGLTVNWEKKAESPENTEAGGDLFFGAFTPISGRTYELQIVKNGEKVATATTILPADPTPLPQSATGDTLNYSQPVTIDGIQGRPLDLKMKYDVFVPETGAIESVVQQYSQAGEVSGNGWQFFVFLKQDQLDISRSFGVDADSTVLGLRRLSALVAVESDEYIDPENSTNFRSAHGFFGSIGRYELTWTLDANSVSTIGFIDQQGLK